MGNIFPALFEIALYPFTSGTGFVTYPVMLSFYSSFLILFVRIIRGKF